MPVYVDSLTRHGSREWCHVIADTLDELHAACQRAGLKREWFQPAPPASANHYDAQKRIRALLIAHGAIALDRRDFVNKVRELRRSRAYQASNEKVT